MKKMIFLIISLVFFLSFSPGAIAQGKQAQNQNQTETTQIQATHQEMEQLMEMSQVTEQVRQRVRTLAQEQLQVQNQIQSQVKKLESRSGLMKKVFGPNRGAINALDQLMEENEVRVRQLEEIKEEVYNWSADSQIQTAIEALNEQNTALQEQIQLEEEAPSLFGWLFKLLAGS